MNGVLKLEARYSAEKHCAFRPPVGTHYPTSDGDSNVIAYDVAVAIAYRVPVDSDFRD